MPEERIKQSEGRIGNIKGGKYTNEKDAWKIEAIK